MNLEKKEAIPQINEYSKVLPIKKFILYYICSFGLYVFYWTYISWKNLKEEKHLDIWILPRTIFGTLFMGSLARHTLNLAKEKGYTKTYTPIIIFILFFLLSFASRKFPEPADLVYILCPFVLLPIVKASNYYWETKEPHLKVNNKFSITSIIISCYARKRRGK